DRAAARRAGIGRNARERRKSQRRVTRSHTGDVEEREMVPVLASLLAVGVFHGATPQPRQLIAGPVFAGDRVIWGEQRDQLNVLRAAGDATPLWQSASSWLSGPLAGSDSLVAFSRSFDGCAGQPGVVCPVETQPVAGPP